MRRYLIAISSVAVILTSPAIVLAQESNTTTSFPESSTVTKTPIRTQVKESVAAKNQAINEARDAFKQKLAEFKDQQKATRLTNLDTKLSEINKRVTTRMDERLQKLTEILGRISTKGADLESKGENTTTLDSNITAAQTAIDAAKTKVDEQAAKDYIITLTTETAAKTNASSTIKQFRTDITAAHKSVVDAQAAVRKAFVELQKLAGSMSDNATTPTATP